MKVVRSTVHTGDTLRRNIMRSVVMLVSTEQKQLYADNLEHSRLVRIPPFFVRNIS